MLVGDSLGKVVGLKVGRSLACFEGYEVGEMDTDGACEGFSVGKKEGLNVGTKEGLNVGTTDGGIEGVSVGATDDDGVYEGV